MLKNFEKDRNKTESAIMSDTTKTFNTLKVVDDFNVPQLGSQHRRRFAYTMNTIEMLLMLLVIAMLWTDQQYFQQFVAGEALRADEAAAVATNETEFRTISNNYCMVTIGTQTLYKEIGAKWYSPEDPCTLYNCQLNTNVTPVIATINTTTLTCQGGYCKKDMNSVYGNKSCCDACAKKTKCQYNDEVYEIGHIWRNSKNNCILYECSAHENGEAFINTFQKKCPSLPVDCPNRNIYQRDCCAYCSKSNHNREYNQNSSRYSTNDDDAYDGDGELWTEEYYGRHPCARECRPNEPRQLCRYRFIVEWYETLSKACYNCPNNLADCQRAHCIAGDGIRRSITVVNRMMPGPTIEVCQNDIVQVDVKNHLIGDSTTIHWHGMHMLNTPYMDGVPHVTQCPINPHATFRYIFKALQAGTHFWHSHSGMQRGDGVFGALIVKRPHSEEPHGNLYDLDLREHKILIQDWIHKPGISVFASHHHSNGDNKPFTLLINGKGRYFPIIHNQSKNERHLQEDGKQMTPSALRYGEDLLTKSTYLNEILDQRFSEMETIALGTIPLQTYYVKSNIRYRFRIINAEFLNCPVKVSIDNHTLRAISSDGYDFQTVQVDSLVVYAGERFDVVLTADQPIGNYWMRFKGLMDCDERFNSAFQVAILRYEGAPDVDPSAEVAYHYTNDGIELNSMNQGSGNAGSLTIAELNALPNYDQLSGVDMDILKTSADHKFYIYYDFYRKDNPIYHPGNLYGINANLSNTNRLFTPQLNHISMSFPSEALLSWRYNLDESNFCNETSLMRKGVDCRSEFCMCQHILSVPLNSLVEIILVDEGFTYDANHPFHLHGYSFRVLGLERLGSNVTIEKIKELDKNNGLKRNFIRPPIKDTVTVPDGGYTIIRFRAYNPGYWFFHCHLEFHAEIGMGLIFKIGTNDEMPPVPRNFPACNDYMPTSAEIFEGAGFCTSDASTFHIAFKQLLFITYSIIFYLRYLLLFSLVMNR